MLTHASIREDIVNVSRQIYQSGMTCSTGGNISVRVKDEILISKTDSSFSRLKPEDVIVCDLFGNSLEPGKPSKEIEFHALIYRLKPGVMAVVHVHSPFAIALGGFGVDRDNAVPLCTPGAVTRVGTTPTVEFHSPGHPDLAKRVIEVLPSAENAIYLEKHGLITFALTLDKACDIAEEFEQNAKIFVVSGGRSLLLTNDEVDNLKRGGKK